jgi:hypothetical protein
MVKANGKKILRDIVMERRTWKSTVLPLNSSNEAESITTSAFPPASSSATNMVSSSGSTLEGLSSDIRYWKPWQPPEVTVTRRWLGCGDLKGAEESAGEEDVSVICCSLYSVMTLVRCHTRQSPPKRDYFSRSIKAILTHLCSSRGYFNCHIFSVLIDSWVLSNNCIVGGIGRRGSLSVGMHTAGGR